MTGQDISGAGVISALVSGYMTVSKITGYLDIYNLIMGRRFFSEYANLAKFKKLKKC